MEGGTNIQERESQASQSMSENPIQDHTKTCSYFCCHPSGTGHRFVALFFMCFLGFGSYFCYDTPASLQDHIKKELNLSTSQYTLLYSLYSWPNVILCFVGGVLIDRVFGIRLGANIYMALTMLGHLVFATGTFFGNFYVMLVGRFIFGIGGESLAVAQNNYAVLWFKGKELNMVFGLQLSISRVGSTVNFWIMSYVYDMVSSVGGYKALGVALYIAGATCVFSMVCGLILGIMDKRSERILVRESSHHAEEFRMLAIFDFKLTFWLVTVICVTYYVTIFPFISVAKDFFMKNFDMTATQANFLSSVVYIISGVASPLFGFTIDKVGRNIVWILVATCFTAFAHILLGFTQLNPYVGMVIMGLSYSTLASSLWPLVSLVVPEHELGTAYGVCQSIQNLGLAVISIVTGVISDHWGYKALSEFFLANLVLTLIAAVSLFVLDSRSRGILNMSPSNRLAHQQSLHASEILEREKLLAAESTSEYLDPNSDTHIRNRYLSRIGAPLPSSYNVNANVSR